MARAHPFQEGSCEGGAGALLDSVRQTATDAAGSLAAHLACASSRSASHQQTPCRRLDAAEASLEVVGRQLQRSKATASINLHDAADDDSHQADSPRRVHRSSAWGEARGLEPWGSSSDCTTEGGAAGSKQDANERQQQQQQQMEHRQAYSSHVVQTAAAASRGYLGSAQPDPMLLSLLYQQQMMPVALQGQQQTPSQAHGAIEAQQQLFAAPSAGPTLQQQFQLLAGGSGASMVAADHLGAHSRPTAPGSWQAEGESGGTDGSDDNWSPGCPSPTARGRGRGRSRGRGSGPVRGQHGHARSPADWRHGAATLSATSNQQRVALCNEMQPRCFPAYASLIPMGSTGAEAAALPQVAPMALPMPPAVPAGRWQSHSSRGTQQASMATPSDAGQGMIGPVSIGWRGLHLAGAEEVCGTRR